MDNNQTPKFDPETGRPLTPPPADQHPPQAPKFDPETGKPLTPPPQDAPRFDPQTGRPLNVPEPQPQPQRLDSQPQPIGVPPQGQPMYGQPQPQPQPPKKTDGLAIGALICGILSLVCCCCAYLACIPGIVAIVLAILSKKNSPEGKFSGMALGGLICGIIGSVLGVIMLIFSIVANTSDAYVQMIEELIDEFYYY